MTAAVRWIHTECQTTSKRVILRPKMGKCGIWRCLHDEKGHLKKGQKSTISDLPHIHSYQSLGHIVGVTSLNSARNGFFGMFSRYFEALVVKSAL